MTTQFDGYRLRPQAEADLETIWHYSARRWSVRQAEIYIYEIMTALEDLALGRCYGRRKEEVPDYLNYAIGSHNIWFRTAGFIDVVRILHQSMDVDAYLI